MGHISSSRSLQCERTKCFTYSVADLHILIVRVLEHFRTIKNISDATDFKKISDFDQV